MKQNIREMVICALRDSEATLGKMVASHALVTNGVSLIKHVSNIDIARRLLELKDRLELPSVQFSLELLPVIAQLPPTLLPIHSQDHFSVVLKPDSVAMCPSSPHGDPVFQWAVDVPKLDVPVSGLDYAGMTRAANITTHWFFGDQGKTYHMLGVSQHAIRSKTYTYGEGDDPADYIRAHNQGMETIDLLDMVLAHSVARVARTVMDYNRRTVF